MKTVFYSFLALIFLLTACQSVKTTSNQRHKDYSKYKEISYTELIDSLKENPAGLSKEKYCGAYYPVRIFYRIPHKIKKKVQKDERILMVTPRNGEYRMYLLFPREEKAKIKDSIRNYTKLNFVYEPLGMFDKRSPLLRYISARPAKAN